MEDEEGVPGIRGMQDITNVCSGAEGAEDMIKSPNQVQLF